MWHVWQMHGREAFGEHHHGFGAAALEGFHARPLAAHHRHDCAATAVPRARTGSLQHGMGLGHLGPAQLRLGASACLLAMAMQGAHGNSAGGGRADRGLHGAELVQHLLGLCASDLRLWHVKAIFLAVEAKIGLRHDPLIKAIADETLRKLPQFSPQGLVNTLWGFATLVIKGEARKGRIGRDSGQECLGKSSWQLINALLEEIIKRLPDCTTQELSNSSWACCRLGVRHDGFMMAIAQEGLKKVSGYTCQDLANTATRDVGTT